MKPHLGHNIVFCLQMEYGAEYDYIVLQATDHAVSNPQPQTSNELGHEGKL